MKKVLIVIPARGGSKGIPRKNIRMLVGKPLIQYSIQVAKSSSYFADVCVTTEDDEIAVISQALGISVIKREANLSSDEITLDPVIHDATVKMESFKGKRYDIVVTMQPTSPLLKVDSLDGAIARLDQDDSIDTIISACNDTHLTWSKNGNQYEPNYTQRVNRQYLSKNYKETGGFLISKRDHVQTQNRIGHSVDLFELGLDEAIDIDDYQDWSICEFYLTRKKILFVVSGNKKIGLGHVYNTLLLANDLLPHSIEFLVTQGSEMAFEKISTQNYKVSLQKNDDILIDIQNINPDLVVNDILDTKACYISSLKNMGVKIVNFEDLGEGTKHADVVINAIYPELESYDSHYYGHNYFLLRDEFILNNKCTFREKVTRVLVTFGGVDPSGLTKKVIASIYTYCMKNSIELNVVAGFGYKDYESLEEYEGIKVHKNCNNISQYMNQADIVFTSAGRTIYELVSLATPAIVLAQNERELTHLFASEANGLKNLGLGRELTTQFILEEFIMLVEDHNIRRSMYNAMRNNDLLGGRDRVRRILLNLLEL